MQDILPLILTLLAIVLILYLSYIFSRFVSVRSAGITSAKYMNIVDRISMGQDRFLLIVSIQQKHYLLGVSGQSITLLKELDDSIDLEPIARITPEPFGLGSFKSTLQSMISKKK
jgi:flagellar protein FliO/FliZ